MKKRTKNVLLIGIVALIWAWVFVQIFETDSSRQVAAIAPAKAKELGQIKNTSSREVYKLRLDYPDPFLRNEPTRIAAKTVQKPQRAKKQVQKVTKSNHWPQLTYEGSIKKKSDQVATGFVKMRGKTHLVSQGDGIEQIQVEQVWPDSILLSYNGDQRVFFKK